jgi:endonuclease YncB( thermonuclease family)
MACFTASRPTDRPLSRGQQLILPLSAILLPAFLALSAAAPSVAAAQTGIPTCGGEIIATGDVVRVIDGKAFVLADGRGARLAGIEAPPVTSNDPNEEHVAVGQAAKAALEALLARKTVILKSVGPGPDRYGRFAAQAFVSGAAQEIWVQYEILTKGYGMVAAGGDNATCLSFLRGVERRARIDMRGLWGEPYFVMKEAQYPDDVMTEVGRFALVAGKVVSVRESGALVYLNFGRRWTEDFTVTITKRNQRTFAAAGLDPKRLAGRYVEVRGYVEEHGGPVIEAARPDQIEIVGGN